MAKRNNGTRRLSKDDVALEKLAKERDFSFILGFGHDESDLKDYGQLAGGGGRVRGHIPSEDNNDHDERQENAEVAAYRNL